MILISEKSSCCGCEACVQACPKRCISFSEDSEGFLYPKVDTSHCVECGACEKACPIAAPYEPRLPLSVWGAINRDDGVRLQSSSGGVFTMLAEQVLAVGGVIFGVRFDEAWQAVFDYTEAPEGLAAFRGSKYVQARVGNAFKEARGFLRQGRKVLFSGTPCQVAALRHFLQRDYDNLLLVDLVCHGVPSPKVWRLYLGEVTRNAVRAITDVQFRSKKQGWKRFNFDMAYDKNGRQYNLSSCHRQNHYMRIFLHDVILRPSCYDCKAKEGRSGSDITIADFWGISRLNPGMDDDRGASLVLLNSEKGATCFQKCDAEIWETKLDDIVRYNKGLRSAPVHPKRDHFFTHLDTAQSVTALIDDTLRPPLLLRMKRFPKRLLRKARHILRGQNGGGNLERASLSVPTKSEAPAAALLHPVITTFTFRSKQDGWKRYRMEMKILAKAK